jgi:hypothetical protein
MALMHFDVLVTEYSISLLPETDINYPTFLITVQYGGFGRWGIFHMRYVLNRSGEWVWNGRVRYASAEEAIERAKVAYPKLRVNGWRYDGSRISQDRL